MHRLGYNNYLLLLLIAVIIAVSCKKETEMAFSAVPKILLLEVTPDTVQQYQQKIDFVLQYQDGDGDLGFDDPDSTSLVIYDQRLAKPDTFFVQPLSPPGSKIAIKGILRISLPNTFLIGNGGIEKTIYTIKIKDRAQNWSNLVSSKEIVITP